MSEKHSQEEIRLNSSLPLYVVARFQCAVFPPFVFLKMMAVALYIDIHKLQYISVKLINSTICNEIGQYLISMSLCVHRAAAALFSVGTVLVQIVQKEKDL